MHNNGERAPVEAALADTVYEKRAQVANEPLGVQWQIANVPLAADREAAGAVAVLAPSDGEAGVDILHLDLLAEMAGDAPLCRTEQIETVDSPSDWIDLTDGWAL
jgi:hypothetical protein